MDTHIDTSWCYVCACEIMPKRFLVPVAPPPPPAAPPSSPSSSPSKVHSGDAPAVRTTTRSKSGTIRARGGLVQGTGRVKPNGAVKRSDSVTAVKPTTVSPPSQPLGPQKHRTVIDQGPIPLYCSDDCRMSDLNNAYVSHDFDPRRESLSTPPVPHNSYTSIGAASSESESDSSSGGSSSVESHSSMSWSSESVSSDSNVSPSIATLAALYDFPPFPPPAPILEHADSSDSESAFDQYQSGVMMAARRIKAALCPEPPKRSSFNMSSPPVTRGPIPGWTDGSDAWRSSVYSLSSPANAPQYPGDDKNTKAYRSTVASPHRSRGVHSTLGEVAPSDHSASTASLPSMHSSAGMPAQRSTSYADDLYSKYPLSFSRRSESRTSLVMSSSPPTSSAASARSSSRRRQEKSLLKPGAEGKLLVPDVKMKTFSPSQSNDSSYDAASLSSWRSGSSYPASSRRSVRSPLSRYGSEISDGGMLIQSPQSNMLSLPTMKRPSVETRSWSYDNLVTYPVMPPIAKKEKRIQRQVVDGEEREVEVEVEITQPIKRLFLFSGKEGSL